MSESDPLSSTNAVIVICSRTDSRRVPNKAFAKIAGREAIRHILERVKNTYPVILAVPSGCHDYDSAALNYQAYIYRGHSYDPLRRMIEAVQFTDLPNGIPDYVIRITHDDILIDAEEMVAMVEETRRSKAGYGFSPGILDGAGVEAIAWGNLIAAAERTKSVVEHISYFVKGMPPNSKIVSHIPRSEICRPYRMTLDYPEDLQALELVLRKLGPDATAEQICQFIDMHPQIAQINKRPILSVYTCAKDAEKYVDEAIESVMLSTYQDMEYIFVDDGSIDDTALIAAKYVAHQAHPFHLHLNEYNRGLASSSNHAIAQARGEYVLRLDADDILIPHGIGMLVDEIRRTGADIVYPDYISIGDPIDSGHKNGSIYHHAGGAIMRRQFINALWFKEGLKWWDSLELHTRAKAVGKIAYLHQPAFYYRQHSESLTRQNPSERQAAAQELGLPQTGWEMGI